MTKAYQTNRKKQENNKTNYLRPKDHVLANKLRKNGKPKLFWNQWRDIALPELSIDDMKDRLERCTRSERGVLSYLVEASSSGRTPSMSRERIARTLGISIRTVGRSIKRLEQMGFIDRYRRYMSTSIYKIHHCFKKSVYHNALQVLLPVMRAARLGIILLPALLLSVPPKPIFYSNQNGADKNVSLINKKNEFIYKPGTVTEPKIDKNSYFTRASNARLIDFPKNFLNGTGRNGYSRSEIDYIWEKSVKQRHHEYYNGLKNQPGFSEIIQNSELNDVLYSEPHKEIQAFLGLTNAEAAKMFAYDDRVLEKAVPTVKSLADGLLAQDKINDRLGWLMGLLKRKATELSVDGKAVAANWPFCWKVMETLGISRDPIKPRSFVPPYNRPTQGPRSEYTPEEKDESELKDQLMKDIAKYTQVIQDPDTHLAHVPKNGPLSRAFLIQMASKNLKRCTEELQELEANN